MTIAFNIATLLSNTTTSIASLASTATNVSGGTSGSIPYQSSTGTTLFLSPGSPGQILQSNGSSPPSWATAAYTTATAVQYMGNSSASAALTPAAVWSAATPLSLTDAPTVTIDLSAAINFSLVTTSTVGPTRAMLNPTNAKPGQTGWISVQQSTTGSNAVTFGANWHFSTGTVTTVSNTANALDLIFYTAITNNYILTTIARQWF